MDYIIAKNKVIALYTKYDKSKDYDVYESLSKEEVSQIFFALQNRLPGKDFHLNLMFAYFISFSMSKYDRFGNIRQRDTDELRSMYRTMLNCLKKLEPKRFVFSWMPQLNTIRWDVYRECANRAITEEVHNNINSKIAELEKITLITSNINNLNVIEKCKAQLKSFLIAVKSGITTTISTSLPYKLTPKNSTFHLWYEGIEIDVNIENSLKSSPLPYAQINAGCTLDEMGLSKNSYSESKLTLCFHCLIDEGIDLDSVSYSEKEEFSWNYIIDFTYKAIKSIWVYLQSLGEDYVTWPPLPQDIGTINWVIKCGETKFDSGIFTNPSTGFRISSEKRGFQHHDLGKIRPALWSDNSLYYARLYAKAGQFEETIFWINVATEALIDEFIKKISPNDKTYEEIIYQESKFKSAEEILSEQFPEMKGKVKWPDSSIHASVFTKLKRALQYLGQENYGKKIIKSYSFISAKRNGLFHGGKHEINRSDVAKVFKSFYQIKDFFSNY